MTTLNSTYDWSFLPHFIIRSTGFPFQLLEDLTFTQTHAAIQQLLLAEQQISTWEGTFQALWDKDTQSVEIHKAKQYLQRKVKKRNQDLQLHSLQLPHTLLEQLQQWVEEWDRRLAKYSEQQEAGLQIFTNELTLKRRQLHQTVSLPAYQEAVFLSSPDMYYHHVQNYVAQPVPTTRTSEQKRTERRLFSYLQRFCGKNETSSFFGPLNYGQIDDTRQMFLDAQMRPSPLIQYREDFLSFWAVKALNEAIKNDERLFDDLPLRLHPMTEIRPDGTLYVHTHQRHIPFRPWLRALDGTKSSAELRALFPAHERQMQQQLELLIRSGLLQREIFIPSTIAHPLSFLLTQLEQLPSSLAQQQWIERCRSWQHWCQQMETADLPQRLELLQTGERLFTEQTTEPARRGQGSLYADRFIFYEEAKGHIDHFIFGKSFHDALRTQLRGALELSAMQGYHEWQHYQTLCYPIFRALSPDGRPIPFFSFIAEVRKHYPTTPAIPKLQEQLCIEQLIQSRAEGMQAHSVSLHSQELPITEYEHDLYSLPDIFLAAENTEALQRGTYQVILGKLHHHLLLPSWLTQFYASTEQLQADVVARLTASTTFQQLVCPEVVRRNKGFYRFPGKVITFSEHSLKEKHDVLSLYDIEVCADAQGFLRLQSRVTHEPLTLYISLADQIRYLPFAIFALPALTQMSFSLGEHTPRIQIDGVVYQRERWEFPSAQWKAVFSPQPFETVIQLRKLQEQYQLPNWVYVRGSAERKPVLIDLHNFFSLEVLQSILEHNESILVEEMLPMPEQLWLQNEQGKYSCELRMNLFKTKLEP